MSARPVSFLLVVALGAALIRADRLRAQVLEPAQRAAFEKLGARWDKRQQPGFSVAIVREGELAYAAGHGHAQLEFGVANAPDTVFHVASVSKQFTAFALVLLAQDGKLSLDDDVREHVPWVPDFGEKITIRHLLNHTSGLRDQWELLMISGHALEDVLTQDHILRILRRQRELNFSPGSQYLYSNMGYSLAAHIVTRVSGKPFEEFCRERIFDPLGMMDTHFHRDHRRIVPKRAYSYAPKGRGFEKRVLSYANVGATSLFTTAPDLAKWLANLGSGKVGGKGAVLALRERGRLANGRVIGYALGVMTGRYRGHDILRHGGADAGFRSDVAYLPELDLGVAVVANSANVGASQITNAILARLVARAPKQQETKSTPKDSPTEKVPAASTKSEPPKGTPKRAQPAPKIPIAKMAGRYLCPELDVFYEIRVEEDRVWAENLRWGVLPLVPRGSAGLAGRAWYFRRLDFTQKGGAVTGFRLSGSRVRNLRFVRVDAD